MATNTIGAGVVLNEGQIDVDFRVEGNSAEYLLMVDGSSDCVGIGIAAPAVKMHIAGTDAADTTYLRIENKPATAATHKSIMEFWGNEGTSDGVSYNIGRIFGEFIGGAAYANTALVLGSASGGGAFNDEITLQNGNVGIGTAAPANALHIVGSNSNTYVFDGYDGDNAGASGITNLTSTAAVLSIIGGNDSTGQDAGLHLRNENTNIDWALYLDLSDSDKFKISRETVDVLDIDSNGKATFAGDVRIEGTQIIQNPASGEHAEITMRAGSGANALLIMEADNSEDNVDTWKLQVADGGIFSLQGTGGGSWANALYFAPTSHDATFTGDLIMADGKGIDFSADASPSAGMTAEILDDYEEGTWTAVVSDGTNPMTMDGSIDTGYYTKVGNLVTVTGYFVTTSLGSASSYLRITGLPFTIVSDNAAYSGGGAAYGANYAVTAGTSVSYFGEPGGTYINLRVWNATTGTSAMQASEWTDDGAIIIGFSYRAA